MTMNPSQRTEEYIILFDTRLKGINILIDQKCYERVSKKKDILPMIIEIIKNKNANNLQVFVLGKELNVEWE